MTISQSESPHTSEAKFPLVGGVGREASGRRGPVLRRLRSGTVLARSEWTPTSKAGLVMRRVRSDRQPATGRPPPDAHVIAFEVVMGRRSNERENISSRSAFDILWSMGGRVPVRHSGAVLLDRQVFEFADGETGVSTLLAMRLFPCMEVIQHHAFRWCGDRVHHLVGTLSAHGLSLEREVVDVLRSYRPDEIAWLAGPSEA